MKYLDIGKFSCEQLPLLSFDKSSPPIEHVNDVITSNDATAYFKRLMIPLVNSLRAAKNDGKTREETDWWFPICMTEDAYVAKSRDGREKRCIASLAAHLHISKSDLSGLIKKSHGMWKKTKRMGFPISCREHGGIQWVILENEQATILPKQQSDGGHVQPAWVEKKLCLHILW